MRWKILPIWCIIGILTACPVLAGDTGILPIQPVPGIGGTETKPIGTPDSDDFDGFGTIDRIGDNEIVIDDTLIKLNDQITFYSETGVAQSKTDFAVGNGVAFVLNAQGEIVSLWKWKLPG